MKRFNIAIDGPSGVGKSTISDLLAEKYGMRHLDTGAMYRCVALYLKENNTDITNDQELREALEHIHIQFQDDKVLLNDADVSSLIRTNDISMYASKTSALVPVREKLVDLQQEIARNKGYIVDGRDICTVVLPDAEVKLYLDASAQARATRRYNEYIEKGVEADYETIYDDIVKRDYQDSHREMSPLKKADDAVLIDTSELSIQEVIEAAVQIIEQNV